MKKLAILLVLTMTGCAAAGRVDDRYFGKSMADVQERLGDPDETAQRGDHVYWAYYYHNTMDYVVAPIVAGVNLLFRGHGARVIEFTNGSVSAYGNPQYFGFQQQQYMPAVPIQYENQSRRKPARMNCTSRADGSGNIQTDCEDGGRYESR